MKNKLPLMLLTALVCVSCVCTPPKTAPVTAPETQAFEVQAEPEQPAFSPDQTPILQPETPAEQPTLAPEEPQQAQSATPKAQPPKTAAAQAKNAQTNSAAVATVQPAAQYSAADEQPQTDLTEAVPPQDISAQAQTPETAEEVFTPEQAAQLIARDRAKQTLSSPVKDNGVFDDEPIIPTDGRRLSPFAYEPLQEDTSNAQWRGEQLKYGVYYAFIKAGNAYIKNRGLTEVNGRKAFLIQTSAFSASAIDAVFKVRDINYSWIDAETFKSLGYTQSLREGNYKRDEWLTFDAENHRYYGEVEKKDGPRALAGELTEDVLDMLSSLYYVRTKPLEIGKDIVFDIVNREKQYPLVVKVLKQETVKTAAGKFNCWVVEPKFRGEGIFVAKGKSLKVWLTADEYKLPVKMQAEVFIGSVKAELLEYKRN